MTDDSNSRVVAMTARWINSLPVPESRTQYRDTKTPSLALRVTQKGTKTFSWQRRIDGRLERITLGKHPGMTIDQARKAAQRLDGEVASGINPSRSRRDLRGEDTLDSAFGQYIELHAKPHKSTWRDDQQQYERHIKPVIGSLRLSAIRRADIQALHQRVGKRGKYAANRVLALLSSIFTFAIKMGWDGANPSRGVTRYRERSRDRFLQQDEMKRFWEALDMEPNRMMADFFTIALLTGARTGNVKSMRWIDISFSRREWRIPATKNGDPLTVPLVDRVIDILHERKRDSETGCEWVFPGRVAGRHVAETRKAWQRIADRAGISDVRQHDLRRSMGSWQAATGASLPVIGKTLGHRNTSTTAIYARLSLDPVRHAVEAATTAMIDAGNHGDGDKSD